MVVAMAPVLSTLRVEESKQLVRRSTNCSEARVPHPLLPERLEQAPVGN